MRAALNLPVLTDGVIRLRTWVEADAGLLAEASTDPPIQRYSLHRSRPLTVAEAEEHLQNCTSTWLTMDESGRPTGSLVITDVATDASLGQCGVDGWSDGDSAQVGYWLLPAARGRGIATRALVLLTAWLFDVGAQCVFLTVADDNVASMAVAHRAGFAFDGPAGTEQLWIGRQHKIVRFAITSHSWQRPRQDMQPDVSEYIDRTRATYDAVSDLYHQRTSSPWPGLIPHLDWFAGAVGPSGRAVDVGCGPGRDTSALRDRGVTMFGLDLSSAQLKTGGLRGLAIADMRFLPLRSQALDGLWCQAAFQHVPREHALPTVREFRRVLRAGACLYLCTTEGAGERWETERYGDQHPRWFVHHLRNELVGMLRDAGFDVLSAELETADRRWVSIRASARE